jgi:hypothetical protein
MSTRGFSRRDLLQLGGRLVMTVGAAKIVIALPGCGGDSGSVDAPPHPIDGAYAYDGYPTADASYPTLDDCHSFGTYDYAISSPGAPPYTYHYYLLHAYGCATYVPYPGGAVYCYYIPGLMPGYDYACWNGYYVTTTTP